MNRRIHIDLDEDHGHRDAREQRTEIDIDMNPMVDLAFLLLTFFMLTTTFARPQTMELLMPAKPKPGAEEKEQPVKESKTLNVVLSGENDLYWYQGITDPDIQRSSYSEQGIHELLLKKKKEVSGLVVLIKPQEDTEYGNLVDILDEMKNCEIERYAIVSLSPEEQAHLAEQHP